MTTKKLLSQAVVLALSNPRLRTPGVSPGVKASEGGEVLNYGTFHKCHGREPVGIYFPTIWAGSIALCKR